MRSGPFRETTEYVEYTCDHPRCVVTVIAQQDEAPLGFSGTVVYVNRAGAEVIAEWFACRHVHIRGAIFALTLKSHTVGDE